MADRHIAIVAPFDPNRDSVTLSLEWPEWRRSIERYLRVRKIEDDDDKIDMMLHCAGPKVQTIYDSLPEMNIPGLMVLTRYEKAVKKLDFYFMRKTNINIEKRKFRCLEQNDGESMMSFVFRLRQQASRCNFQDDDANIIEQIIAKTKSAEHRKKIIERGSMTVDEIIDLSEVIALSNKEDITREIPKFSEVNAIKSRKRPYSEFVRMGSKRPRLTEKDSSDRNCFRCGKFGHFSFDVKCPAKASRCVKCGRIGHFQIVCRSTNRDWKNTTHAKEIRMIHDSPNSKDVRITVQEDRKENVEYVMMVGENCEINKGTMMIIIGGIETSVLVDSGADVNILDLQKWKLLKEAGVKILSNQRGSSKILRGIGSPNPLEVVGEFEAIIQCGKKKATATFYVITNCGRTIIGRKSAMDLEVLKIGQEVNQINSRKLGKIKNVSINLNIDPNIPPVTQPYRRIPIPLEQKVREKIYELLDNDIIEPVCGSSKWVSPLVIVPKGDSFRLCVDMRRANEAIIRENHPIPTVDSLMTQLRHSKIFSKIDIKQAFHQLEIDEESRYITTFISNVGLFRYKRLMFGISCAPEIFQKTMERILAGCDGCFVYIDDILVFGETNEQHDRRLNKVLNSLKDSDVELNDDKNEYHKSSISFLGHIISSQGVRPMQDKIDYVVNFRQPKSVDEVRSFLGLVNYVGKFVPNLATIAEPLYRLVRTNVSFKWNQEQETAFQTLKQLIANPEFLGFYDPNDTTYVMADASPIGLGAVLFQGSMENKSIISYASKSLTDVEKRYSQTEKEALALVWSVEKFHLYLFGKKFILATDHKPLQFIFSTKSRPCARIERWVLRLQTYKYSVMYIPGKSNIADPFSRLFVDPLKSVPFEKGESEICEITVDVPDALTHKQLQEESKNDETILKVKECIMTDIWPKELMSFKLIKDELFEMDSLLLRGNRIIIPISLRKAILQLSHEGHPGMTSMKSRLRSKMWWPNMDQEVEQFVRKCKGCQLVSQCGPPEPMKRRSLPSKPWEDLAIDFLGPLPSGDHIFVIVDFYSRFFEIEIMRKIDSKETIKTLKTIFARYGIPRSITSDNGPQFKSGEFLQFCQHYGIHLFNSTPYWPQENGEVERQNRSILKRLAISQNLDRDWRGDLLDFLLMYRSTPHSVLKKTPSELMFGRNIRDKLPQIYNSDYNDESIRDRDEIEKEKGKAYGDQNRRAKESDIEIGDTVLLKNQHKQNKLSPNFLPSEHEVIDKKGQEVTVKDKESNVITKRNSSHMKKIAASGNDDKLTDEMDAHNELPKSAEQAKSHRPQRDKKIPSKMTEYEHEIKNNQM